MTAVQRINGGGSLYLDSAGFVWQKDGWFVGGSKGSRSGAIAGTVDILKRLKQAGYPVYGLSNWSAETFPYMRERHDFFDLFDDMVISGEVGHAKPEPEIFQILLDKIGRPAKECLFIDDSLTNIGQAQKLGFATILFQSPQQLESSLRVLQILF